MRPLQWLLILLIVPFVIHSGGGPRGKTAYNSQKVRADIRSTHFDIPIVANEKTASWIDFYQTRGRKHFARHLERSARYIPMMQKILRQHGLPKDLVYVALIESGFSAHAYSRAHAVGFWQFIRGTARRYKLRVSRHVDERRDFEKATHAAANYFKDLYERFGDWHLAMAGYNAGEGKIEKAIRRYKTKNYWKLIQYSYLRPETKDYVPKFQAAALIAKNPEKHGFKNLHYKEPFGYDEVNIKRGPLDLRIAAKLAKSKHSEIEELNPELNRWYTPPDRSHYALRLPKGTATKFKARYASLPKHRRMADKTHKVKTGDTLDLIAKKYDLPLDFLAMANGLGEKGSLKAGKLVGIPSKPPKGSWKYRGHHERGKRIRHRVRSGDSLWKIARRYKVSLKDLKRWNKGRVGKYLRPGQTIHVNAASPRKSSSKRAVAQNTNRSQSTTYTVKRGDTLSTIAAAHGVRTSKLRGWNKGKLAKYLKPGQKLTIRGKKAASQQAVQLAKARPTTSEPVSTSYRVRSGDTLSTIAAKQGVRLKDLKNWNKGKLGRYLKPGQSLTLYKQQKAIPIKLAAKGPVSSPAPTREAAPPPEVVNYKVRSGDSLWEIAQKHRVRVSDLKKWNGNKLGRYLKPGQRIAIRGNDKTQSSKQSAEVPKIQQAVASAQETKIYHTIQSGDTLWDIARKYRVSTKDLKKWNDIERVRRLKPGDKLKIFVKREVSQEV